MGWIKTASVVGFILSVIAIVYFFYSFISGISSNPLEDAVIDSLNVSQGGGLGLTGTILIGIVLLIACFFFMFGFFKTGEKTDHKMLRVSTWLFYGSVVFIFLLFVILTASLHNARNNVGNTFDPNSALDFNSQIDFSDFDFESVTSGFGGGLTGNAVTDVAGDFLTSDLTFLLILFIIGVIVFLVGMHLFYVSVAEHNGKVKFARLSAIFGLFTFNVGFLVVALSIFLAILFLFSGGSNRFWLVFVTHLPYLLGIFALSYMSFFLKDSADKFE